MHARTRRAARKPLRQARSHAVRHDHVSIIDVLALFEYVQSDFVDQIILLQWTTRKFSNIDMSFKENCRLVFISVKRHTHFLCTFHLLFACTKFPQPARPPKADAAGEHMGHLGVHQSLQDVVYKRHRYGEPAKPVRVPGVQSSPPSPGAGT